MEEGCDLKEGKTQATAIRTKSRPGMVPKATCWLLFQAQFAGNMPADGKVAGSGPAQELGPYPRVPPRIEPRPLEWPPTWWLREEGFLQAASPSAFYRPPKGFQVRIPRIPDAPTPLKCVF